MWACRDPVDEPFVSGCGLMALRAWEAASAGAAPEDRSTQWPNTMKSATAACERGRGQRLISTAPLHNTPLSPLASYLPAYKTLRQVSAPHHTLEPSSRLPVERKVWLRSPNRCQHISTKPGDPFNPSRLVLRRSNASGGIHLCFEKPPP